MVFGRHINRYYLRYFPALLLGLLTLVAVDILQLRIPRLYQMVINGIGSGFVDLNGAQVPFTMDLLLEIICMPMVAIIVCMVLGRFLWRVCFFGSAIRIERNLGGKKPEKYLIYGCAQDIMPVTLAKFPTEEAAKDELLNIAAAMQNGNAVYAMPQSEEEL